MKRTKLAKKAKTKSLGWYQHKAWDAFSAYIRARDKGYCITCKKDGFTGSNYHAGHCIPSAAGGIILRFNEKNVNGQCGVCNIWKSGEGAIYGVEVDKKYGVGTLAHLIEMRHTVVKADRTYYIALAELYKEKLIALQN